AVTVGVREEAISRLRRRMERNVDVVGDVPDGRNRATGSPRQLDVRLASVSRDRIVRALHVGVQGIPVRLTRVECRAVVIDAGRGGGVCRDGDLAETEFGLVRLTGNRPECWPEDKRTGRRLDPVLVERHEDLVADALDVRGAAGAAV